MTPARTRRPVAGDAGSLRPPARLRLPGPAGVVLMAITAALIAHAWTVGAAVSPATALRGLGRTWDFLAEAFPPDLSRGREIAAAMLETFEIALLGSIIGVVVSAPLAVLAARNLAPNRLVHAAARGVIAFFRTVPDILWGLLFVVTVGLGPEAGVLAIAADVTGLCGRFFADRLEDVPGPLIEALRTTGARKSGILLGGVAPSVAPSFVAISLYGLENATRSSVVLGVVGAGGIGIELTTAMELLRYDEATTIVLAIFVAVLAVERTAASIRRRLGVGLALTT